MIGGFFRFWIPTMLAGAHAIPWPFIGFDRHFVYFFVIFERHLFRSQYGIFLVIELPGAEGRVASYLCLQYSERHSHAHLDQQNRSQSYT